jgi:membrane protein YqaA with SNARE-associated domain
MNKKFVYQVGNNKKVKKKTTSNSHISAFNRIGVMAVMLMWVGGLPPPMWMTVIHLNFIKYE